jgi:CheY-like chemotaxis protein
MVEILSRSLPPDIELAVDVADDVWLVEADPGELELALLNLAINARDAMPEGGMLSFATMPVQVANDAELEDGDYIALTISDTGSGMPPEVIERAFEPFFTTKEVGKGTGLGLSMVYGMARQSGGTARIESAPGKGTSVTLLFRKASEIAAEAKAAEGHAPAPDIATEPLTILVIDDDPDVRDFIAATLEEQGYGVVNASDGREGVRQFDEVRPDLVIVDFIMPGLSGAEVARKIRAKVAGQPILFVSGYSETDAVKRTAPDAPLLTKPFRADALHKAVRGALPPGR